MSQDQCESHLEVDTRRQDRNQSADAIDRHESETIFIDAQHHLKATSNRLDVLVVLKRQQKSDSNIQARKLSQMLITKADQSVG